MTCPRSVYSWHIVFTKVQTANGPQIWIDKRDNSNVEQLHVNECAVEPPSDEIKDGVNTPQALAEECSIVNHRFIQQVTSWAEPISFERAAVNPPLDGASLALAHKYRQFNLGSQIQLIVRTELNAYQDARDPEADPELIFIRTFNEFDSKGANNADYRQKLDLQRGAVLATEFKNNSCKLARWCCQAMLAGADLIKLGFVSRVQTKTIHSHSILGMQTYASPADFASGLQLSVVNMWGICKTLIDILLKDETPYGVHVLLRDPNTNMLKLYAVPAGSLDEEEPTEVAPRGEMDD
jgi:translation initiation factor 3 subunit D